MAAIERKSFLSPDETASLEKAKIETVTIGGLTFQRATFEPGWRWSKNMKPIVKTDSCQKYHVTYIISGRIKVVMNDGTEVEEGPGDLAVIPPGHDAWVVGKEPCVFLELGAAVKQSG